LSQEVRLGSTVVPLQTLRSPLEKSSAINGPQGHWRMRVMRGFRVRFDLDCVADVVFSCGSDSGIPEKQAMAIWIVGIKLHGPTVCG